MSSLRYVCLLCQVRQTSAVRKPSWQQQSIRNASSAQRRVGRLRQGNRKPARMQLSPDVAKPSVRYGNATKPRPRLQNSPFGGMNQTDARLRRRMPERSTAEERRASGTKKNPNSEKKQERPLFKALKMQKSLETVPYERRNAIKSKVGNITSFDQFRLLPVVREAINTALSGMRDLTPTPIQRHAGLCRHHRQRP